MAENGGGSGPRGAGKVIFNLSRAPGEPSSSNPLLTHVPPPSPLGSQGACVAFSHQNMTFHGRPESSWRRAPPPPPRPHANANADD